MDAIIQQWDCAAKAYRQSQKDSDYVRCNKALVQARFPQFSGESVLDLGCGYGCYTDYFGTAGADVIGIDGSEKMIELARSEYPNPNQVLMDIEDIAIIFSECRRILKPEDDGSLSDTVSGVR